MIERVKRVSHVKPVSLGASGMDAQRDKQNNKGSAFQHLLAKAMRDDKPMPVSETYILDVNRATHSLFYEGRIPLDGLGLLSNE